MKTIIALNSIDIASAFIRYLYARSFNYINLYVYKQCPYKLY